MTAIEIPELRKAMAEIMTLQTQVAGLLRRQEHLERSLTGQVPAADADRDMALSEVARAIGKSPATLAKWTKNAALFERNRLGLLLQKDVTGHWISSPRRLARWREVTYRSLRAAVRPRGLA
jgi:hypothetical protein